MMSPHKYKPDTLLSPQAAREHASSLYNQARAQGLLRPDAALRLGRQVSQMRAGLFRELAVFPDWVVGWMLQHAHAAAHNAHRTFDYRGLGLGIVQASIRLMSGDDGNGEGLLRISWECDAYHEQGWWLALYLNDQEESVYAGKLGEGNRGQDMILTSEDIGFNPREIPFQFVIYPG